MSAEPKGTCTGWIAGTATYTEPPATDGTGSPTRSTLFLSVRPF